MNIRMRHFTPLTLFALGCPSSPAPPPMPEPPPEPHLEQPPPEPQNPDATACRATGCSSTVCADDDVMTTCEFRPEHECYKSAVCERGSDGQCGWRGTPELTACLEEKKASAGP